MRYFVIGDDGQKYGPADVPTLQAWIAEGRLLPTQQVEEEGSGIRSSARAIPGLNFPLEAPQGQPGGANPQGSPYAQQPGAPYQGYPRQGVPVNGDGKQEVTASWVLGVLGFLCCFCGIAGIVYGYKAKAKGHPGANAAIIACWAFLVIQIAWGVFRGMTVYNQMQNGTLPGMQKTITK